MQQTQLRFSKGAPPKGEPDETFLIQHAEYGWMLARMVDGRRQLAFGFSTIEGSPFQAIHIIDDQVERCLSWARLPAPEKSE